MLTFIESRQLPATPDRHFRLASWLPGIRREIWPQEAIFECAPSLRQHEEKQPPAASLADESTKSCNLWLGVAVVGAKRSMARACGCRCSYYLVLWVLLNR